MLGGKKKNRARSFFNEQKSFKQEQKLQPERTESSHQGHLKDWCGPAVAPSAPGGHLPPVTLHAAREQSRRAGGTLRINGWTRRGGQGAGAERQRSRREGDTEGHDTGRVKG